MADPFADIVVKLQGALVAECVAMDRTPVIVAVQTLDALDGFWSRRPRHGVTFAAFEGRSDAVVQSSPWGAMLWMDPWPDGYRAVYDAFLRRHWGATQGLTNSGYDVDHVYNKARAKHYGYKLVRMFLVKQTPNRAHGSGYEKPLGAAEANRHVKIMKLLDGMSELKVLGLPPVANGLLTPEHHAAAQRAATQYGIPLDMALDTLRTMFSRAHPEG